MSEDDAEREHEPTPKRIEEARRKGDVVRSPDLAAAAASAGFAVAAWLFGPAALKRAGDGALAIFGLVSPGAAADRPLGPALSMTAAFLPLFALPAAAVLTVLLAQRAIVFAPDKLRPKLSRIDPLSNARQKFGRGGLAEFAKSFAKLLIFSLILGVFIANELPRMLAAQAMDPRLSILSVLPLLTAFLLVMVSAAGAIGALDWLWQRHEFLRRNRMTRQEILDESKDSEGDPQMKGQRRRRAEAIATRRMLTEVPRADVVIVNPTHYAVALKWQRGSGRAPACVAKGVDEIAARIRETAASSGVPVRSDPPAARAIYASVEIGREILPEHYAAVAAAIRFAEAMRLKARNGWRRP